METMLEVSHGPANVPITDREPPMYTWRVPEIAPTCQNRVGADISGPVDYGPVLGVYCTTYCRIQGRILWDASARAARLGLQIECGKWQGNPAGDVF